MQDMTRRGFIGAAGFTAVTAGLALTGCNGGGGETKKDDGDKKQSGGGQIDVGRDDVEILRRRRRCQGQDRGIHS